MAKRILSEIWIYPVKSLGGIRVRSAKVCEKGLYADRRWMLVDDQGKFLTQRAYPKMALFKLRQSGEGFEVMFGADMIRLPEPPTTGETMPATIWNDTVQVLQAPSSFHPWFSERLGMACRLVHFPESHARVVDPMYRLNNENVSLADGYPILIIGQSSLDDLNNRLAAPVPMNRFRPNFVFTGGAPYEEDGWRNFRVAGTKFVGVKTCARCVLTTVDQDTGIAGREPLLTLSKYRRQGDRILFGQNVIPVDFNEVHEGDEVFLD